MKKGIVIIVAIVLVLCAAGGAIYYFTHKEKSKTVGFDESIVDEDGKEAKVDTEGKKVLVLYFSETGNTQALAKTISDQVGGDFRRIEPVTAYPGEDELTDYAKAEKENNERPAMKALDVNPEEYDVIFIGYPIWWYTMPMIIYTFLDEYDLSGVTIVPYNTHEGSGDSGTYETIQDLEPNATVLEGLAVRGNKMSSDQTETVVKWLESIGF